MNDGMNRPEWAGGDDPDRRRPGRGGRGRRAERDAGGRPEGHGPHGAGPAPFDERGAHRGPLGRPFGPGAFGGPPPFPGLPDLPGFGPAFPHRGHGGRGGRARRGDVRAAILALLAEEPRNGYQLIQALGEKTNGAWKPSPGAVYPALAQLTDEGLVAPLEREGQKLFDLTDGGRTAASEIGTAPWDAVNQQFAPVDAEGAAAFWPEVGKLAMAARAVAVSGTPAQVRAATELVAEARRRLYGLLAEDAPGQA